MFIEFKKKLQKHVAEMLQDQQVLFVTGIDKDKLWEIYLESFLPGTNEIFRKRKEHDCSYCRHFIKSFGNVVIIKDNKLISIWDFKADNTIYQPVINALSTYVKSESVCDVFITKESNFGVDQNHEQREGGTIHTWDHFRIKLPKQFVSTSKETIGTLTSRLRDVRNVLKRSLEEISKDAIETILDLIIQKSLYKGKEWHNTLDFFLKLHCDYHNLSTYKKGNYCWTKSVEIDGSIGKIRNHSIGTLLLDITNNVDLNEAVRKWDKIVDPLNYKHPKTIYSKKQVEQFEKDITELGYLDSLNRRHATINDVTVNNILFANKNAMRQMTGNIFSDLKQNVISNPKKFDRIDEVSIETFINDILPRTTNIELYLENRHASNFMSVIAPKTKDSKIMFKWNNNFTWAYDKNVTDSIKERVKVAGGKVDGILRFSIQWNDDEYNPNDFDAHCVEPNKNHIYYPNKIPRIHPSTGRLDVDVINPVKNIVSVENITWTDINKIQEGRYKSFVHCYSHRGGLNGFKAEIEYDRQIYSYEYNKELRQNENVIVAEFNLTKAEGIKFIKFLPSSISSKTIWNIQTNQFHPVSICMFSPNYWDEQKGIGHKHYFFIMNQCKNPNCPNGFFNEFLKEDLLLQHKGIFEALGNKMRVNQSDNQLSGLGFSSTKRNSIICKLEGHVVRTIKIIF